MVRSAIIASSFAALAHAQGLTSFLESREDLSTLLSTLQRVPDTLEWLENASNITLLAPTNAAFEFIGQEDSDSRAIAAGDDLAALDNLLRYHVLDGTWPAEELAGRRRLITTFYENGLVAGGQFVAASGSVDDLLVIESGSFIGANIQESGITGAGNGTLIHTLGDILVIPKNLSQIIPQPNIVYGLEQADLLARIEASIDVMVFDPSLSEEAIDEIPADDLDDVLLYHVTLGIVFPVQDLERALTAPLFTEQGSPINRTLDEADEEGLGGRLNINGVRVISRDRLIANGIIHDIDGVLDPADAPDLRPILGIGDNSTSSGTATNGTGPPISSYPPEFSSVPSPTSPPYVEPYAGGGTSFNGQAAATLAFVSAAVAFAVGLL